MSSDVEAGRAFVTMYVRDRAFRAQMAENEQLYQEAFSSPKEPSAAGEEQLLQLEDQIQGYEVLQETAGQSMSLLLQDTGELAEQTERLNIALEEVMANYGDLAGMQEEGVTLSIGGGGGHDGGGDGWLDIGQVERQLESSTLGGIGKEIGAKALGAAMQTKTGALVGQIGQRIADKVLGQLGDTASQAIDSLGDQAMSAGQKLLSGPVAGGLGKAAGMGRTEVIDATIVPNMGAVAAATQGMNVVMAEVVPVTQAASASLAGLATVLVPLAPEIQATDIVLAELVPGTAAAATGVSALDASMATLPPIAAAAAVGLQGTEIVMAELVPEAVAATVATNGLAASMWALVAPIAAVAAVAAVVLVPALAAIDNATGGALSESGYYPEWLKKIGDTMLMFGPAGMVIEIAVGYFKELWSVVSNVYELFSNFAPLILGPMKAAFSAITLVVGTAIKLAFMPLHVALFALNAPFRTVHLVVNSVKAGFDLAQAAVVKFVDGVKALPGLARDCAAGLGRMAINAAETVRHLASSAWSAAVSSINAISGALQSAGKWMAIAGGSMAAVGAMIVGPLTKAAETFTNHGEKVHEIAKDYELSAEAAATYAYMASQTGRSVKELTKAVKEGSDEFAQWNQIAFFAGWTIGDAADSAVSLAHAYKEVKDALHGLWVQFGRAVAPAIEESTRLFGGAVRMAVDWVRHHQELITTAFKVASTIAAVGSALATAGGIVAAVGAALSPFTVALAGIAAGLAAVEYKTKAGATVWGAYKDSLFSVFGTVMSWIKPAIDEVKLVIDGIKDAVLAGDIDLVFDIVVNEIKAVWAGGLAWLADKTGGIFGDILGNLAAGKWQAAADGAMGMLTAAFWRANQVIDDVWESIKANGAIVWSAIQDGFDVALASIEGAWLRVMDKMKEAGHDLLVFLANKVFGPMAKMAGEGPIASHLKGVALSAQTALMNAANEATASRDKNLQQHIDEIAEEHLKKRNKRHTEEQETQNERDEAAVGRWADRRDAIKDAEGKGRGPDRALSKKDAEAAKELTADWQKDVDTLWQTAAKKAERMTMMENNPSVYNAEKQSNAAREWEEAHKRATEEDKKLATFKADVASRTGGAAEASNSVGDLIAARDAAIEKAKIGRDAFATPDDPAEKEKAKSYSGFVTTSAYAFGQFSATGDPAKSQVEELKKARLAKAEEKKQRDAEWRELLYWQKLLGTKSAEETRNALWDMGA